MQPGRNTTMHERFGEVRRPAPIASARDAVFVGVTSNDHISDHLPMHIGQSPFDAVVIEGQPLMVEPHPGAG